MTAPRVRRRISLIMRSSGLLVRGCPGPIVFSSLIEMLLQSMKEPSVLKVRKNQQVICQDYREARYTDPASGRAGLYKCEYRSQRPSGSHRTVLQNCSAD